MPIIYFILSWTSYELYLRVFILIYNPVSRLLFEASKRLRNSNRSLLLFLGERNLKNVPQSFVTEPCFGLENLESGREIYNILIFLHYHHSQILPFLVPLVGVAKVCPNNCSHFFECGPKRVVTQNVGLISCPTFCSSSFQQSCHIKHLIQFLSKLVGFH